VVDSEGTVYGHVVASDVFGKAYVVPMEDLFRDIATTLSEALVSLPSTDQLRTRIPLSAFGGHLSQEEMSDLNRPGSATSFNNDKIILPSLNRPLRLGGIYFPAIYRFRLLLEDLQCISDAPKSIERLKISLGSMEMALTSLRDNMLLTTEVYLKKLIHACTKACYLFHKDLQRWMKRSNEGKLSWQDRTNVRLLRERQINAMSGQFQACQMGINLVVDIETLCVATFLDIILVVNANKIA
jgi:hypothetical protein